MCLFVFVCLFLLFFCEDFTLHMFDFSNRDCGERTGEL